MKKLLSVLLLAFAVLALFSCDGSGSGSSFLYLGLNNTMMKIDTETAVATPLCPDPLCKHYTEDCAFYTHDGVSPAVCGNGETIFFMRRNSNGDSVVCRDVLKTGVVERLFTVPGSAGGLFIRGETIYCTHSHTTADENGDITTRVGILSAPLNDPGSFLPLGEELEYSTLSMISEEENGFLWMADGYILRSDMMFGNVCEYTDDQDETRYGSGETYLLHSKKADMTYIVSKNEKKELDYCGGIAKIDGGAFLFEMTEKLIGYYIDENEQIQNIYASTSDTIHYFDYANGTILEVSGFKDDDYYNVYPLADSQIGRYILMEGMKFSVSNGIITAAKPIYLVFNTETMEWKRVTGLSSVKDPNRTNGFGIFDYEYDD